ncbi:nicotinic acid mononucleotide adenyltransferase [Lentiprolixibacter aurantiacus]|uniref:Nicotinic acid mononucleotide adenyltransferase n=1 Tax=Lentiprolixibacter aurantiacus TaxID=2993939 RepID=A0AAE3MJ27_9FLAO|nr:nicotinic acid mononucleotide adenyltransferase [Lentiprolixibacter aurantiacus]MCX2718348.1 nicotinic acid mononucleotide adenyltransferase [Lentiprolixibacter aurantiacus]
MRAIKLLPIWALLGIAFSSCYTEVIIDDEIIVESPRNTEILLESFDLWYVDINASSGSGEVPFLQQAFTITFDRGVLWANNNLVGLGKTGNGLGISVGYYSPLNGAVEVDHDVDGLWLFDIYVVNGSTIELYHNRTNTSYILQGYQRHSFDYDGVFYDNIQYFLQEYTLWEKVFTSEAGALNDFDEETYLQFLPVSGGGFFRSSIDPAGIPIGQVQWDYEGEYQVFDVPNDATLKTLTLDYDFMGNDYFELYVPNDNTLELYHPDSGTLYEFRGRGFQQYLKSGQGNEAKKRSKQELPVMDVKRKRPL